MRTHFGVVRKSATAVAVTLFVVAQPQMLCALHCMVFGAMGDMGGVAAARELARATALPGSAPVVPAAHRHHPVAVPCGHGMNAVTAPTLPVAGVGPATVSTVGLPFFGMRTIVFAAARAGPALAAHAVHVDPPPPRA